VDWPSLAGQVVLLDFWDYTCINCLQTFPYLQAWEDRYAPYGLQILGIHTPEFRFAQKPEAVIEAIHRLGITYPVALDGKGQIWQAYGNQAWPVKYLIDPTGRVRAYHVGEGAYAEMEAEIQALLTEAEHQGLSKHPGKLPPSWPAPVPPVRPIDDPVALCHRPTPEIHLGFARGSLGNADETVPDQAVTYTLPAERQGEVPYVAGMWRYEAECLTHRGESPGTLSLGYRAVSVYGVLVPPPLDGAGSAGVWLWQDDAPLAKAHWGEDVQADPTTGLPWVAVDTPRLYHLVENPTFQAHQLSLVTTQPDLQAYALTFVTGVSETDALA
jgi:thiol-disulfide isomerase/thioredoxin